MTILAQLHVSFSVFFLSLNLQDEQILPEVKKVKQTNDNISKSNKENKENEEVYVYRKSDYSSLVRKNFIIVTS